MISIDSNLLLFAYSRQAPEHADAKAFLQSLASSESVAISEFILVEFYVLLRNPAVLESPLSAAQAAGVIRSYRLHPRWQLIGFAPESLRMHDALWKQAEKRGFARRRIFDARTAFATQQFGVKEFATANVRDFEGFGFQRVWNPLEG